MLSAKRAYCYAGIGIAVGLGVLAYWVFQAPVRELPPLNEDEKSALAAYNQTALQLYKELRTESGNLVLSPYSIGTSMAMARTGARGDTETEMATVLNNPFGRERIDDANAGLTDRLDKRRRRRGSTLCAANAVCLTDETAVAKGYRDLLQQKYAAEVFSGSSVRPINSWVADRTRGKIKGIIGDVPPASALVLLNAIYFEGKWASKFDPEYTQPAEFHTTADTSISVPMMMQTTKYRIHEEEDFQAISLPYRDTSLAMVVILPRERMGLASMEEELTIDSLQLTFTRLQSAHAGKVHLELPRFAFSYEADLIPPLQALGMTLPFSPSEANFEGITGVAGDSGRIWLGEIRHKAMLEVDEEGTRAAAATSSMFLKKAEEQSRMFEVDHPFLFLIVEIKTNAILFLGRVTNPLE